MLYFVCVVIDHFGVFDNDHVWVQEHCNSYYQGYADLSDNFVFSFQSIFIVIFYLAVVIKEPDCP